MRLAELREEELLDLESEWWEREEETNHDWIHEGIQLFGHLSRKDTQNIHYKEMLAYLLVLQGEDLKLRQHSYEKAFKVFRKVVQIERDHARAYYRLGFLYFYEEKWPLAIDAFQHALNAKPRVSNKGLEKDQEVKAYHYIMKAAQVILNENLHKVEKLPPTKLELFSEIKLLMEEIKEGGGKQEKPYVLTVNGKEQRYLTEKEYEELSDPSENRDCFILNQYNVHETCVFWKDEETRITSNDVPLLTMIMLHPEGISSEAIIRRKYPDSFKDPQGNLRKAISRLRSRLLPVDPSRELIETVNGSYKWNCPTEYRMFKHTKDVSSEVHLD